MIGFFIFILNDLFYDLPNETLNIFQVTEKLYSAALRQNTNQFEFDCLATDVVKFLIHYQKLIFLPIKTDSILSEKFNFFNADDNNYKV